MKMILALFLLLTACHTTAPMAEVDPETPIETGGIQSTPGNPSKVEGHLERGNVGGGKR